MTAPHVLSVTAPALGVVGPPQGLWTYDDYASVPDDGKRYEVVKGVLYMTPAPNFAHQNAVSSIGMYLKLQVDVTGRGKVVVAPIDVELAPETVVQPDVVVVLNRNRQVITSSRVIGAPDLVVEVASPSTATYDRRAKLDAYARAGVPEYWIADPAAESVEVFVLDHAEYTSAGVFEGGASLPSLVIPDFRIAVEKLFA